MNLFLLWIVGGWSIQPVHRWNPHRDLSISRCHRIKSEDPRSVCAADHLDLVQELEGEDKQLHPRNGRGFDRPRKTLVCTASEEKGSSASSSAMEGSKRVAWEIGVCASNMDVRQLSSPVSYQLAMIICSWGVFKYVFSFFLFPGILRMQRSICLHSKADYRATRLLRTDLHCWFPVVVLTDV